METDLFGLELGMTYEDSSYSEAWRVFTIVLVFFYRQKQSIVFEDLLSGDWLTDIEKPG